MKLVKWEIGKFIDVLEISYSIFKLNLGLLNTFTFTFTFNLKIDIMLENCIKTSLFSPIKSLSKNKVALDANLCKFLVMQVELYKSRDQLSVI